METTMSSVRSALVNMFQNSDKKSGSSSSSSGDSDEKKKKGADATAKKKPKKTPIQKVFNVFYKLEEKNYPSFWKNQSYVHFFEAGVHLIVTFYLIILYVFVNKYISLYDGYDGGSLILLMMGVSGAGTPISVLSGFLTLFFMTQMRLGRSRYQMFFAAGSSAILALSSVIMVAVCLGSFFTTSSIFQAGFYLNMERYHDEQWIKDSISTMQERFECCGNINYTDWFMIMWSPLVTEKKVGIPLSCCKHSFGQRCVDVVDIEELHQLTPFHEGCNAKVQAVYIVYLLIACFLSSFTFIVDVLTTWLAYVNSRAVSSHEGSIFEDRMKIIPYKLKANRLMRAKRNKIMKM